MVITVGRGATSGRLVRAVFSHPSHALSQRVGTRPPASRSGLAYQRFEGGDVVDES